MSEESLYKLEQSAFQVRVMESVLKGLRGADSHRKGWHMTWREWIAMAVLFLGCFGAGGVFAICLWTKIGWL